MKRIVVAMTVTLLALAVLAGPAAADHDHGKTLGNGDCVVLAQSGAEKHVVLPGAALENNKHVDEGDYAAEGRSHPLHVFVHTGPPGAHQDIYVSDGHSTCDGGAYRNVRN